MNMPFVQSWMYLPRLKISAQSLPISGQSIGSPPQIDTTGAPHSSTAARHCASVSRSLIVDSYSRIRPHPVQVRLRSEEHTSELQSRLHLVCRLLLEKK